MREIKFRGKHKRIGWVYGYCCGDTQIKLDGGGIVTIALETIGEYTGLKDKNNKEIYEGDIIKNQFGRTAVVEFHIGQFVATENKEWWHSLNNHMPCTIIGNIHQNSELLTL